MPFTQYSKPLYPVRDVCDGCDEHCKLGSSRYQAFADNGYGNLRHYYYPKIGETVITFFRAPNGVTVENLRSAGTRFDALIQAAQISKLCDNYKNKQGNQR